MAEQLLGALVRSQTTPMAIELLLGPEWRDDPALRGPNAGVVGRLVVGLEGTADEVAWMQRQLADEWAALGAQARQVDTSHVAELWQRLAEFPAQHGSLTIKASILSEATVGLITLLLELDSASSIQAHAGSGIVVARFRDLAPAAAAKTIVNRLQPAARAAQGDCIVLSYPDGFDTTRQVVWGGQADAYGMMRAVKEQLDPKGLLNPGRFVY
jgi:glycolate oxidase FAD binding subunit